jgi:peroxiredoxin
MNVEKISVGSAALPFSLPAADSGQVSLSEALGQSHLVVYFMRAFN